MRTDKLTFIVLFLLFWAFPLSGNSVEIEFGLPDSLQGLNFWDGEGEFVGEKATVLCPDIPLMVVTPESGLVDSLTEYTIDLTLPSVGVPKLGGVAFAFPIGFGLNRIVDIIYSDDFEGYDLEIRRAYIFGSSIVIFFKWGISPPEGTVISLKFISIKNPKIAGSYRVAGLIFNKWFRVEAGPGFSEIFEIFPDQPISLNIYPDSALTLKAGTNQLFEAVAIDRFGNRIWNLDYQWSLSDQYDNIGIISNGNLFATTVGTGKVVVTYEELFAESGLITVGPGDPARLAVTEYPPIVTAGEIFPSPVMVFVYDAFNNIKSDYVGQVYFTSSDPMAQFTYDETNRYQFTIIDAGQHTFPGSRFQLMTAGQQTLAVTDGTISSQPVMILVGGGTIASFDLEYDASVMAGKPFVVRAVNAVDQNGDPANGLIMMTLIEGGSSPDGFEPVVNPIVVQNGSGESNQYLYRTGAAILKATFGSIEKEITFDVLPANLGDLALDISETQFVGNPLIGVAEITAFDKYGNIKTDFDVSQSPVTLMVDEGELNPSILESVDDFIGGIANLIERNIVYSGPAGDISMSCFSGDVTSNIALCVFNGITFHPVGGFPSRIYIHQGVPIVFSALALNDGNLAPQEPIIYTSYFASCLEPCLKEQNLETIIPGDSTSFAAHLITDGLGALSTDTIIIVMEAQYLYDGDAITVRTIVTSPVDVIGQLDIEYIENSLTVDSLLAPSILGSLSLKLRLPECPDYSSSWFKVELLVESEDVWRMLFPDESGYSLDGNILTVSLYGLDVPDYRWWDNMPDGYRNLRIEGYIHTGETSYSIRPLDNFDSVFVAYPSVVSYQSGTLSPVIAGAGAGQIFEFNIGLDGFTTILLDPCQSRFELYIDDIFIADACLLNAYPLVPGITHIMTREVYIPDSLMNMTLAPALVLKGKEIYYPRTDRLSFEGETIHVTDMPRIKVASADLITVNPPYVNQNQAFSISVGVENLSETEISGVSVIIKSEDGSETYARSDDLHLLPNATSEFVLDLTAPAQATPIKIYKAVLVAGGAAILLAEDNTVAVVVQKPAEISLMFELHDAYNGIVDFDQPFYIIARMKNLGEAKAGSGEVSLLTDGVDFGIPDSSAIRIETDSSGIFRLTAPSEAIEADMRLKITDPPIDLNTGQPALIKTGATTFTIKVEPSFAELVVNGVVGRSPLIVEGSSRELFRLELFNNTENPVNAVGIRSIIIRLTDRDGQALSPDQLLSPEESGFYLDNEMISAGVADENLLRVVFDDDYVIYPGEEDTITFRARFNEDISVSGFSMSIDSRDIRAVFIAGPRANQSVPVRGKLTDSFRIGGNFAITVPGLENSLTTRNNPFNPKEGPAEVAYILERSTDVVLTIYTLTGEKVYEKMMPSGSSGAAEGQNYISWDGTNDEGKMVVNGIYIMLFKPADSDKTVKLKVAVLK
ncbi:MAG: hypothetical protein CVT49_09340 [candidate division Zixibacteria bacterium HGW-Zixibacteria-1]|nr:MAG: hypothetical protein CVT49_09340 [candidate division Zixibacteria bacterium HGW-Zixibacteria-1]